MEYISEYIYGMHNVNARNHYEMIDLKSLSDLDEKIVFVFGGANTNDTRRANGMGKVLGSLIGDYFTNAAKVISVAYNNGSEYEAHQKHNASNFVKQLILPRVSHDSKKIDVREACKNLRNIFLCGYCHGEEVISVIFQILNVELENLGYTKSECKEIQDQIFCLYYAAYPSFDHKSLTVISATDDNSLFDSYMPWINLFSVFIDKNLDGYTDKFEDVRMSDSDRQEITKLAKMLDKYKDSKLRLYVIRVMDAADEFIDKHDRCFVLKNLNRIILATSHLHENDIMDHSIEEMSKFDGKFHENVSKAGEAVVTCMLYSLRFAINHALLHGDEPLDMNKLKQSLEAIVENLNFGEEAFKQNKTL